MTSEFGTRALFNSPISFSIHLYITPFTWTSLIASWRKEQGGKCFSFTTWHSCFPACKPTATTRTKAVMRHPLLAEWTKAPSLQSSRACPARLTKMPEEEQGGWLSWCSVRGKTSKLIYGNTSSFLLLETSTCYPTGCKAIKTVPLQNHLLSQHCNVSDTRWLFFPLCLGKLCQVWPKGWECGQGEQHLWSQVLPISQGGPQLLALGDQCAQAEQKLPLGGWHKTQLGEKQVKTDVVKGIQISFIFQARSQDIAQF